MKVFEYVVIFHPTEKEEEEGKVDELIVGVTQILAKDLSAATMRAARKIPEKFESQLDQMEIAVRPF